jgi:hypothetical protein
MKLLSLLKESYYSKDVVIRDYTEKEYKSETNEYFKNDNTKKVAPNAFESKEEMIDIMKSSKPVKLSDVQFKSLMNSDVSEIIDAEYPSDVLIRLSDKYNRDWGSLVNAYSIGNPVPPPIVLRDEDGKLFLLAGNTRLMTAFALYKNIPVKIINYKGKFKI